jgi:hypothetical protein
MVTLFPPAVKKDNSRSFLTALNQDKTISTVYLVVKKCQKLGISRDVGLKLFPVNKQHRYTEREPLVIAAF